MRLSERLCKFCSRIFDDESDTYLHALYAHIKAKHEAQVPADHLDAIRLAITPKIDGYSDTY